MTVCPNMPLALNTSLHNDLLLATEVLYTMFVGQMLYWSVPPFFSLVCAFGSDIT